MYTHAIFSTKHREPILLAPWRDELFRVLGGLVNQSGSRSLLIGGVEDHVHLLFRLSRTVTLADTMLAVKKGSSAWVNQRAVATGEFHWQAGYGTFSVSASNVDAVREYIRRQPEHHRKQTFQDEYRDWLTRYEEEWDERYVWD
jgi:putative transposase